MAFKENRRDAETQREGASHAISRYQEVNIKGAQAEGRQEGFVMGGPNAVGRNPSIPVSARKAGFHLDTIAGVTFFRGNDEPGTTGMALLACLTRPVSACSPDSRVSAFLVGLSWCFPDGLLEVS
jgi:hypothetical protein